jgi:hypothetical protein
MRPTLIFLLSLMQAMASNVFAQDVLLMTNGKYRDIKGKVVATEYDVVIWQTEKQARKEAAFLKKHGKTREEFVAEETVRTATSREKLAAKRKEMEAQIIAKMEELSSAEFEKWKNSQLLKLAEEEASIGSSKAKRKKRRFTSRISRELVFSYTGTDSVENVVYSADTLGFLADGEAEVEWGVEDMRKYITGRQDGRRHRVWMDGLIGGGVGTVSALLGGFWGPTIPAGYIAVTSIANTKVHIKARNVDPSIITEPAYLDGYERSAKRKKTWRFIQGSVVGLGVGLGLFHVVFR